MSEADYTQHPSGRTLSYDRLFIGGSFVEPHRPDSIEVDDPTTEHVIGSVPKGTIHDLEDAISAAHAARSVASTTALEARARLLEEIADGLEARTDELAWLIACEVGTPLRIARAVQVGLPVRVLRETAEIVRHLELETEIANSIVIKEPVGTVGALTPWNYPLHQLVAKVAPAIGAGCPIVAKPSELAPLSAFVLAEVFAASTAPPGLFNLVTGIGTELGEALVTHRGIDKVSFTGSDRVGAILAAAAAASIKRITLELGGKSASVILSDAPLDKAVPATVNSAFLNSGQTCNALTRMIVSRDQLDDVLALAGGALDRLVPGDPLDERARLGPVISKQRQSAVRRDIDAAVIDGAAVVAGGSGPLEGFGRGYFVAPTILSGVTREMRVANEEIFGPVLCVLAYEDERDAIAIANATTYGLAGAVWSGDDEHAMSIARQMVAGQVDVNGGRFNSLAPFGGYRRSGIGRELGAFGIDEFFELKSIQR